MMRREHLDQAVRTGCPLCGENGHTHGDPFWIHAACHPQSGLSANYLDGKLTLSCRQCRKLVVEVAVAS